MSKANFKNLMKMDVSELKELLKQSNIDCNINYLDVDSKDFTMIIKTNVVQGCSLNTAGNILVSIDEFSKKYDLDVQVQSLTLIGWQFVLESN